ncbi:MAG: SsrA-binding protein SmpB [bacterium]|nr:SsrA-binding protein SmpB [bacterium]
MAKKKTSKPTSGNLAVNKRATFDYDLVEKFEAGIVLTGAETKSAKAGHVQLKGAYVSLNADKAVLRSAYIAPYKPANQPEGYDPYHDRGLLLHKRELTRLVGKMKEAGLTLVPIRVYISRRLVKVEIALARGKKQFEKRAAIKKRDVDREIRTRMHTRT